MQGDFDENALIELLGEQYVDIKDFLEFLSSDLGFKLAWGAIGRDVLRARDSVRSAPEALDTACDGLYALVMLNEQRRPLRTIVSDGRARSGVIFINSVAILAIQDYYEPEATIRSEFCEKMQTFNLREILQSLRLLNTKLA